MVDEEAAKALPALISSYNNDSTLSEEKAQEVEHYLLTLLCNRLRMQRDFQQHPEIHEQEIKSPVIIVGMARTGSTKTQRMLAASGDFNYIPLWQSVSLGSHTGQSNENTIARIADGQRFVDWVNHSAPEMPSIHEFHAEKADEEVFLLANMLRAPYLMGLPQMTSFLKWLEGNGAGVDEQMAFLRDSLKYLQWQDLADPNKRWVLKTAVYFGLEPEIKSVFPHASLVMTHRQPEQSLTSTCSMMEATQKPTSDKPLDPEATLACLAVADNIDRHIANRAAGIVKTADVWFKDLITDTEKVIREIYAKVNEPLSSESLQRMLDWNSSNPQHAKGSHKYTLEEFGLTKERVEKDFARYINLIDDLFGE